MARVNTHTLKASIPAGADGAGAAAAAAAGGVPRRDSLFRAAVCRQWTGDAAAAGDLYAQVLDEDPTYAPAHVNWGYALKTTGALREAEDHYAAALELDPTFAEAGVTGGWISLTPVCVT